MTTNELCASVVESARWSNSIAARGTAFCEADRLGLERTSCSILSEALCTDSLTSFLSTEDVEVALDLTVEEDEDRLAFGLSGFRDGEFVALVTASSFMASKRTESNESIGGSAFTSMESSSADGAPSVCLGELVMTARIEKVVVLSR